MTSNSYLDDTEALRRFFEDPNAHLLRIGKEDLPLWTAQSILKNLQTLNCLKIGMCSEGVGHGLFTTKPLQQDCLIGPYLGEIVSDVPDNNEYTVMVTDTAFIDAQRYGCIVKYMNHSCEPNSEMRIFVFNQHQIPVVVAKRNIKKNEQITINYKWTTKDPVKLTIPCLCATSSCKKSLYSYAAVKGALKGVQFTNVDTQAIRASARDLWGEIFSGNFRIDIYKSAELYSPTKKEKQLLRSGCWLERHQSESEMQRKFTQEHGLIYKCLAIGLQYERDTNQLVQCFIYGQYFRKGNDPPVKAALRKLFKETSTKKKKTKFPSELKNELFGTFCFEEVEVELFLSTISVNARNLRTKESCYSWNGRYFCEDTDEIHTNRTEAYDPDYQIECLLKNGDFFIPKSKRKIAEEHSENNNEAPTKKAKFKKRDSYAKYCDSSSEDENDSCSDIPLPQSNTSFGDDNDNNNSEEAKICKQVLETGKYLENLTNFACAWTQLGHIKSMCERMLIKVQREQAARATPSEQ